VISLKEQKTKFPYLGQKFKQINLTVSHKSIAGQFVGLHEEKKKSNLDAAFGDKGHKVITTTATTKPNPTKWGQQTKVITVLVCILYAVFFFHVKQ
jgi:hypothetical protein